MEVLCDKLRFVISDVDTVYEQERINITASFGIASFPYHGNNQKSLLLSADSALYSAKSDGRNNVCSAEQFD